MTQAGGPNGPTGGNIQHTQSNSAKNNKPSQNENNPLFQFDVAGGRVGPDAVEVNSGWNVPTSSDKAKAGQKASVNQSAETPEAQGSKPILERKQVEASIKNALAEFESNPSAALSPSVLSGLSKLAQGKNDKDAKKTFEDLENEFPAGGGEQGILAALGLNGNSGIENA